MSEDDAKPSLSPAEASNASDEVQPKAKRAYKRKPKAVSADNDEDVKPANKASPDADTDGDDQKPAKKQRKKATKKESDAADPEESGYDRAAFVGFVLKHANPDYKLLAHAIKKSQPQIRDVWRKVMVGNLLAGKEWAAAGNGGWDSSMKLHLAFQMFATATPDWDEIAEQCGRTPTQVADYWRNCLLPRLMQGRPI